MVTNEKTDQVIFVYPDMVTALLANINTDTWMAEEELTVCQISTLGLENGIIVPCLIKCDYTIPVTKGEKKETFSSDSRIDFIFLSIKAFQVQLRSIQKYVIHMKLK